MKMAMAHVWVCLIVAMVFQSTTPQRHLSAVELYLYAQLEDALVNDGATLEQLREVFFDSEPGPHPTEINFHINITVESIPTSNCSACSPWPWDTCEPAFCRQVDKKASHYGNTSIVWWELCSLLNISWTTGLDAVKIIKVLADTVIFWCAHGPSLMVPLNSDSYILGGDEWRDAYYVPIKISVKKLNCRPYAYQLTHAVGEFFTWVSTNFISVLVFTW